MCCSARSWSFPGRKGSTEGSSTDASSLQFLPRLEYMLDDSEIRPFLAAVIGIGHGSTTSSTSGSADPTIGF